MKGERISAQLPLLHWQERGWHGVHFTLTHSKGDRSRNGGHVGKGGASEGDTRTSTSSSPEQKLGMLCPGHVRIWGLRWSSRPRGQEPGYGPGSEVRRSEVALWGQGTEMGLLLGVRGQGVGRLFSGVRARDLGGALRLHHSPASQAL